MRIPRDSYLNKLVAHMHNGLVKIITGVRRCGKSYLLFNLFYERLRQDGVRDDHIIRASLDDYGCRHLLDPDALYSFVKGSVVDDAQYYILLDEIQLVPNFESVVNGFLHIPNADIYITGSNSRFLSSDIITEFRGRGDEIRVYPLCFAEFFSTLDPATPFPVAWRQYATFGGLPLTITMPSDEDKIAYLKNLFNTTYLADIIARYNLRNNSEIGELTDIIASSIGSLTNPLKLSNTFGSVKNLKLSVNTVAAYLDYLQDAFLIERAVRYDIKGKKYIGTPAKFYFVDMGLRNARLSFRQTELNHIMENVVYNELRVRGFAVDVGVVDSARSDNQPKQLEVDFVANLGSRRFYIQCAYHMPDRQKLEQEEASLLRIDDAFKKIIIVGDDIATGYDSRGVMLASLSDFLLDTQAILSW